MILKAGETNLSVFVFLRDSSVSYPKGLTGLTHSSSSLVAYGMREGGGAPVVITLSAGTLGVYSSGGFVEVSASNMPGLYQFGVPNDLIRTGASVASLIIKGATNLADYHQVFSLWTNLPSDNYTIVSSSDTMRTKVGMVRLESDVSRVEHLVRHIKNLL